MKKKIAVLGSGWAFSFVESVLKGLRDSLKDEDVDIYYFTCYRFHNPDGTTNTSGYRIYNLIDFHNFCGVVLLSNLFDDEKSLSQVVKQIKLSKTPAVSLVRKVEGIDFIHINNYKGFYDLIQHLISSHNAKNFAYIGGIAGDPQNNERYKAFEDVLKANKISINKKIIYKEGDWSFKNGYKRGLILFSDKKNLPDAVVCSNDQTAFGILRAAYQCDVNIPSDVRLIGFDNEAASACTNPTISTVDTKAYEMGFEAAKILFEKKTSTNPKDIVLDSSPVIRSSCGCSVGISKEQLLFPIQTLSKQDDEERFITQIRHSEDIFVNDSNIHIFWDTCQNFYEHRHQFEGENFSILLKKELTKSMLFQENEYDDKEKVSELQVFVNIQDGKKVAPGIINVTDYLPQNLLKGEKNLFVFIPLVFHNNFYGYYVGKNNTELITNKRGYPWSKNFANNIEKFREKTKYRLLSQKYLGLSTKDSLTGLFNRNGLDIFGKELFERNQASNLYTVISFLDVNYLKKVNDKFGHLHGDLALKIAADEIKNTISDDWLPIRYGGDEFVIIGTAKSTKIKDYLEPINANLEKKCTEMALPYKLTISYGTSFIPPDEIESLEDQIDKVDKIMYVHKKAYHDKNPE